MTPNRAEGPADRRGGEEVSQDADPATKKPHVTLAQWLARHPMKSPSVSPQAGYTREVMARIERVAGSASCGTSSQSRWWRASGLAAAAATAILLVVATRTPTPTRLASAIERDAEVLEEVGALDVLFRDEIETEMQLLDRVMVAEADGPIDDAAWIDETLQLLNDVDAEFEVEELGVDDLNEQLQELERLDRDDLASA